MTVYRLLQRASGGQGRGAVSGLSADSWATMVSTTVRAMSVAGRRVSHPLLVRVLAGEVPDVDAALRTAVDRNVVVVHRDGEYNEVRELTVQADDTSFRVVVRIDTPGEQAYYRNGGIMPYVLRQLRQG